MPHANDLGELVKKFPATPFLFVGSGITRRYYGLPSWRELLDIFARRIKNDDFALASYEHQAKSLTSSTNHLPAVAGCIEADFNRKWFDDENFRNVDDDFLPLIQQSALSPFKAEVASFIKRQSNPVRQYTQEISSLKNLSRKSVSGIITTNYDCFLESIMDEYKTFIGQEGLLFSPVQGIAEIYKIHGCVSRPDSIVVTADDYAAFEEKEQYLASKLMTIFLEYPIVFLGYSLNDPNILSILKSIMNCLTQENINKLYGRFVFVEYGDNGVDIGPHSMMIEDKTLMMTKIQLADFGILYNALSKKQSTFPVKFLRMMKDGLYSYILTNKPTATIQVAALDDERVNDEGLAISLGVPSELGIKGLRGLSSGEWYRNIVLDDLSEFTADDMLEYAFPKLYRKNNALPVHKFLCQCTKRFSDVEEIAEKTFDALLSGTIIRERDQKIKCERNLDVIWLKTWSLQKRTLMVAHLFENEIDLPKLENILKELFRENPNILSDENKDTFEKTNLRRVVRIYDYLKYAHKKRGPDLVNNQIEHRTGTPFM